MNSKPLIASGALMDIGMGGFVDGILFHQISNTQYAFGNASS